MELFVAVGAGLLTSEAVAEAAGEPGLDVELELGVGLELGVPVGDAEPEFVGVGLPEGLLLGVPLGVPLGEAHDEPVGSGDAESDEDEAEADDDCDCVAVNPLGEAEGDAHPLDVPDAMAGLDAATPAVAGMTSRAPTATVPVATAPATDTADRPPLRACLGTVPTPSFRRSTVRSDLAPAGRTVSP